jgi:hypothetical protein
MDHIKNALTNKKNFPPLFPPKSIPKWPHGFTLKNIQKRPEKFQKDLKNDCKTSTVMFVAFFVLFRGKTAGQFWYYLGVFLSYFGGFLFLWLARF